MTRKVSLEQCQAFYNELFKQSDNLYRSAAARFGISVSALDILYALWEEDGCSQKRICELCFVSKQTVNSSLRKLEREGFVTLSDLGTREKQVFLTEKGHALAKRSAARVVEAEKKALTVFDEQERETIVRLGERYIRSLKANMEELV